MKRYCGLMILTLLAGCAAEPFERPPLPVLKNPDPTALRDGFAKTEARHFVSEDAVVIEAPFHDKLAVLGVLRVDRLAGTFELVGLNQLGIEFFQLGGDRETQTVRFAVPPLMEQKDLLISLAADIRRMYFDLTPPQDAKVDVGSTQVSYTDKSGLVYELGGQPAVLLEKRAEGFLGWKWRVRYYDYAAAADGLYPRGIVMDNGHYHYRIIVKNRRWQMN